VPIRRRVHFGRRRSTKEEGEEKEKEKGVRWRRRRFGWIAVFAGVAFRDVPLLDRFASLVWLRGGLA
jgi:hypothetical protein